MKPSDQKPLKFFDQSIKGIAFDLDDTLYSRSSAFTSWLRSLGSSDFDVIARHDQNGNSNREDFFNWLVKRLNLESTGQELRHRFITELPHYISPQKTNLETLKKLQARGYQLALLSNGGSALQRAKLAATGLADIFNPSRVLISGELVGDKPDEIVFQELASRMNLPPAGIIFVGDHLRNDIDGSRQLGMPSAWMRNKRAIPANLHEGTLIIEDISDLLPHFPGHERS